MVFNQTSPFASPDWMTTPFKGHIKNAHQHLADILLVIPECMALCKVGPCSLRHFFSRTIPSSVNLKPIAERIRKLLQDLDDWAVRFPHLTVAVPGEQVVAEDMESLATSGVRAKSPGDPTLVLPDSFVALTAATYEALRLILSLLLDKVAPKPEKSPISSPQTGASASPEEMIPTLIDTAMMSSKHILDISAYIESTHPVGFDFMRSVFPLVVVCMLGPRTEEKKLGQHMMERWGKRRGMSGLYAAWTHV